MRFARTIAMALCGGLALQLPATMTVTRIFRPARPTLGNTGVIRLQPVDDALWIWGEGIGDEDTFVRFRADFQSDGTAFELDVTADNRFVLFLDGREIARGPHRGEVDRWTYQTYALAGLEKGSHRMEAVVYHGNVRPSGQLTWRGGFLAKASGSYDAHLTTGKAPWRVAELKTMEAIREKRKPAVGAAYRVHGTSAWADEPTVAEWTNAVVVSEAVLEDNNCAYRIAGWSLFPSERPDMTFRRVVPGRFVTGGVEGPAAVPIVVPPHARREYLWQLGNYYCAYPKMVVSGGRGAKVRWGWTESLVGKDGKKGDRRTWEDKSFPEGLPWAVWDEFLPDGRERGEFGTPWWRAGLWCKIVVETADEPLTITELALGETHYPYDVTDSAFDCDDPSMDSVRSLCLRGLEMCSHETFMDCSFHEQYQYPGDSRIEALIAACVTSDDRLVRYALTTFDLARRSDGLGPLAAPASGRFASATYTLMWVLMCRDYAYWHDNVDELRARLPGMRHALAGVGYYENAAGLLENLPGWSFTDWVEDARYGFVCGIAPDGKGLSAVNNLLYLLALRSAALVERACGVGDYAQLWEHRAERLAAAIRAAFWCSDRALFADTVRKDHFSEHAQCYALLADALPANEARRCFEALVRRDVDLAPASTYFSFYLFETFAKFGRADLIRARFEPWQNFLRLGAATPFENQNPEFRSDCHAWSAAPLYFMSTVFAGVTPSSPGFRIVRIAPQPAGLGRVRASVPSPRGRIDVDLDFASGDPVGRVVLPPGMTGVFEWKGCQTVLHDGRTTIDGRD